MKITKLIFKNINSLAGEWEIDFSNPIFAYSGIFAITGPTGAGKTTILDAICLAMYGKTPRVTTINGTTNEVMSQNSADCFSEVIFEIKNKKYSARWGQKRAHGKSNGNLQSVKREICEYINGEFKPLAEKITDADSIIQEITGMKYDQFTRTILLAQGSFAAFLQSKEDEKSEILEQITGAKIYTNISIKVHEHKKIENDALNSITSELKAIQLLTNEEKEELNANVLLKQQEVKDIEVHLSENQLKINWLNHIAELKTQLFNHELKKEQLNSEKAAFKPEQEKLLLALKASELDVEFATLKGNRKELNDEQEKLKKEQELLPIFEQKVTSLKTKEEESTQLLEKRKKTHEQLMPMLKTIRALDVQIHEQKKLIQPIIKDVTELEKRAKELLVTLKQHKNNLQNKQLQLSENKQWAQHNEIYKTLIANYAAIANRCEQTKTAYSKYKSQTNHHANALVILKTNTDTFNAAFANHEIQVKKLEEKEKELKELQATFFNALNHKDLQEYRTEKEKIYLRGTNLSKTEEIVKVIFSHESEISKLNKNLNNCDSEIESLNEQLQQLNEALPILHKQIKLVEENITLRETIKSLEEHRQYLEDGKPCPLCGATTHPYSQDKIPLMDDNRQQLAQLQLKLEDFTEKSQEYSHKKTAQETNQTHYKQLLAEKQITLTDANIQLKNYLKIFPELQHQPIDESLNTLIITLLNTTREEYKQIECVIKEADIIEKKIQQYLEKIVPELRAEVGAAHQKLSQEDTAKKIAENNVKTLETSILSLKKECEEALTSVNVDFANYGIETQDVTTLDNNILQLDKYRNQWLENEKTVKLLDEEIVALKNQQALTKKETTHNSESLTEKSNTLQLLYKEKKNMDSQRTALFGNKNPDEEEAIAVKSIQEAEQAMKILLDELHSADTQLATSKDKINGWSLSITQRDQNITVLETEFSSKLLQKNFSNEQSYLDAALPENEITRLKEKASSLQEQENSLSGAIELTSNQLQQEIERHLTDDSLDDLKIVEQEWATKKENLVQSIGANNQILTQNQKNLIQHSDKIREKEQQEKQFIKWKNLDDLIGSADGKKYRNFAQGLTFEYMIRYANIQLQKMFDRYVLLRDYDKPLELCVIDNYQGGQVRSVKNLSGGESFVVSLALALGLSNMASKNVQIDSLFLDEGFGTLDEEALDMALTTLSGLRHEGKLIGIISHVQALKDRISTQIQIVPEGNGKSRIEGVGCYRK